MLLLTEDKIFPYDYAIIRFYCHKAYINISTSESTRKRKMLDPAYVYSYAYFGPVFETAVRKRFVSFLALQKRICIFWQMLSEKMSEICLSTQKI